MVAVPRIRSSRMVEVSAEVEAALATWLVVEIQRGATLMAGRTLEAWKRFKHFSNLYYEITHEI